MTTPEPNEPGYEVADMDAPKIWMLAGLLVLGLVVTSLGCALFYYLVSHRTVREEGPLLVPRPGGERIFPRPELQARPSEDMARFRKEEEAVLTGYRWVDARAGVVQIPIERAMELLVQRGVPVGKGTPGPTWVEMMQQRAQEGTTERRAP